MELPNNFNNSDDVINKIVIDMSFKQKKSVFSYGSKIEIAVFSRDRNLHQENYIYMYTGYVLCVQP